MNLTKFVSEEELEKMRSKIEDDYNSPKKRGKKFLIVS